MQFTKKIFFLLPCIALLACYADDQRSRGDIIAFYNVQNLFDTENDSSSRDEEFLPQGKAQWTADRYERKLKNLAACIAEMGDQDGPEILGLCEVENRRVLEALCAQPVLKRKYEIVHYDSPDNRGIDVALLYDEAKYRLIESASFRITQYQQVKLETRDILYCRFRRDKDTMIFLVNHWNSRRGGVEKTEEKRVALAAFLKAKSDSLQRKYPDDLLFIMGDFNDEPESRSISKHLNAKFNEERLETAALFNPFYEASAEGEGTHQYKHEWYMFDQIILNQEALLNKGWHYESGSAQVFHPDWLHYKSNPRNGPFKTYQGDQYYGGYSDHFPVLVRLIK